MQYLLLIVLVMCTGHTVADDIEMVVHDAGPLGLPYIHVVLDTSSTAFDTLCTYGPVGSCAAPFMTDDAYKNLGLTHSAGDAISRFSVFSAVLATIFNRPDFSQVYVSLLSSDGGEGGRLLAPYRQLGRKYNSTSGAQILVDSLNWVSTTANRASQHHFQAKGAFYSWYRYINGKSPVATPPPEFSSPHACSKLFSIVMATESTGEDGVLDSAIEADLGMARSGKTGFTGLLETMHQGSTDLVKRGLSGLNVLEKTWLVTPLSGVDLALEWSQVGGTGRPLNLDDPAALEASLTQAFRQAMSISRARPNRGVAITAAGTAALSSDLYIPLYEPRSTVRWAGNVKKYKLDSVTGVHSDAPGKIIDARSAQAIVSTGDNKGQIRFGALSFWTDVGSLPASSSADVPPGVDGRVVNRGGAGQQISGLTGTKNLLIGDRNDVFGSRQVFVEPVSIVNGSSNRFLAFNADDVGMGSSAARLQHVLGAVTVSEAQDLVRWARGQDVDDEDGDGRVAEARSWVMGSVLHSRPAAVNYGAVVGYTLENPNIRIFVGTGDGVFHSIENTTSTGAQSGREVFAFYPSETLENIAVLREDALSSLKMRYGVDGAASTFIVDNNHDGNLNHESPDNDEAYVYFGLRRGGYSFYALDVSDPSIEPKLKWKISPEPGGDFAELGLGFSKPITGKVNYRGEPLDVVIFAGGYHGGWGPAYQRRQGKDLNAGDDVTTDGSVSKGNAIYIVNARSGELVWKAVYGPATSTAATGTNTRFRHAGLVDSIPSSVSAMRTVNGTIDRLYVGDTGGAIWRVDLPVGNDPANSNHRKERWFVSKLAELGTDGKATDRRFFHAPDLVRTKENDGTAFDGVLISSGNRADPNGLDVIDYHFYIKDFIIASGDDAARHRLPIAMEPTPGGGSLPDRTACPAGGTKNSSSSCRVPMDNGWMIRMNKPGEKGLSSPLVDGGRVFFSSYVPGEGLACSTTPGQGYAYLVHLVDGSSVAPKGRIHSLGKGFPSAVLALGDRLLSPLGGIGEIEQIGCDGLVCNRFSKRLQKTYWREPGIDEF